MSLGVRDARKIVVLATGWWWVDAISSAKSPLDLCCLAS